MVIEYAVPAVLHYIADVLYRLYIHIYVSGRDSHNRLSGHSVRNTADSVGLILVFSFYFPPISNPLK